MYHGISKGYNVKKVLIALCLVCITQMPARAQFLGPNLRTFAVLGGNTVTNTGVTIINGSVGDSPGNTNPGFGTATVTGGAFHLGDAVASTAQNELTTAYNTIQGEALTSDLTGQDLGGKVLFPGVYFFSSGAQLTGTLTLDANGNNNARWDFQIGTTLVTAPNAVVSRINGGPVNDSIYWQVGSSATIDTNTIFLGNVLALSSVSVNTGATNPCGRFLASSGAVTLQSNTISIGGCADQAIGSGTPEPGVPALLGSGLFSGMGILLLRRKLRSA